MQYHSSEVFLHPLHIGFTRNCMVDNWEWVIYSDHAVRAFLDI